MRSKIWPIRVNQKYLIYNFCSPCSLCIIKLSFRPILSQKSTENRNVKISKCFKHLRISYCAFQTGRRKPSFPMWLDNKKCDDLVILTCNNGQPLKTEMPLKIMSTWAGFYSIGSSNNIIKWIIDSIKVNWFHHTPL